MTRPPTDITLTGGSVNENATAGTTVATLSTVDADASNSFSYTITSDPSGFFEISGNQIQVKAGASIDYESATSHNVTVEVDDGAGNTYSEVITLNVNDLNDETPTDITLTGGSVNENATAGTTVATLSTVDADASNSFSYTITSDPSGFFEISGNQIQVKAGASIDYETATSHNVTIEVDDGAGNTYSEVITLNVNDLNDETPTDITLTGGSVNENATAGTTVATLSTVDADASNSFSYTITSDPSGFFEISGNQIQVKAGASIDYETATSHNVTVEVDDGAGNTYSEVITLNVNNLFDETPTDIVFNQDHGISLNTDGGNNAYLHVSDAGDIVGGLSQMTIEVEFSSSHASGSYMPIFSYHAGGASDEIEIGISDSGSNATLYLEVREQVIGSIGGFDARQLLDGGNHQVSLTWDNGSGAWEVFVDGVSISSGTGIATGQTIASGGTVVLGQEQDSLVGGFDSNQIFDGTYHDVRIFNDVRTAQEISDGAFTEVSSSEPGLVANWLMDDLSGGSTTDAVSGKDLTVGNVSGTGWVTSTPTQDSVISEGAGSGTVFATMSTVDADAGDSFTYQILYDPTDALEVVGNEIRVKAGSQLDYESGDNPESTGHQPVAGCARFGRGRVGCHDLRRADRRRPVSRHRQWQRLLDRTRRIGLRPDPDAAAGPLQRDQSLRERQRNHKLHQLGFHLRDRRFHLQ